MVTQRSVLLNDFGLVRRERTTMRPSGEESTAVRYTVSVQSEPLLHVFNAQLLGAGPAAAIAEHLQNRVGAIGELASPATQLKRKYAKDALARGEGWATVRYSGGRGGTKEPGQYDRLFNDSGRLRDGIVATPTKDNNWIVNVPANRFDPTTFKDGEAGIMRMFVRLRELVPEFGDGSQLATVPAVRKAIGESIDFIFVRGLGRSYGGSSNARSRVRDLQWDLIRQLASTAHQLGALP